VVKKPFFTISFIGWMVFVTFSSLYSFRGIRPRSFSIPHADKMVHFTFYFVACILGVFFLRELTKGGMRFKKALLAMTLSMIAFGVIIEVLQQVFTLNRQGDFLDALANSVGALCGAVLVKRLFSNGRTLKWKI
jgi:VanZ family protein